MRRVNVNSTVVDEEGRGREGARWGAGQKPAGRASPTRRARRRAGRARAEVPSGPGVGLRGLGKSWFRRWTLEGSGPRGRACSGTGRPAAQPQDGPLRRERVGSDTRPETVSARARRPCQVVPFHSCHHQ